MLTSLISCSSGDGVVVLDDPLAPFVLAPYDSSVSRRVVEHPVRSVPRARVVMVLTSAATVVGRSSGVSPGKTTMIEVIVGSIVG